MKKVYSTNYERSRIAPDTTGMVLSIGTMMLLADLNDSWAQIVLADIDAIMIMPCGVRIKNGLVESFVMDF